LIRFGLHDCRLQNLPVKLKKIHSLQHLSPSAVLTTHLAVRVHARQQRGLGADQPRRLLAQRRRRALDDVALEDEPAR